MSSHMKPQNAVIFMAITLCCWPLMVSSHLACPNNHLKVKVAALWCLKCEIKSVSVCHSCEILRLEPQLNWTFGASESVHWDVKLLPLETGKKKVLFSQILRWFPGLNQTCASHCISIYSAVFCMCKLANDNYQQKPQILCNHFEFDLNPNGPDLEYNVGIFV